jgi:hypothetical protein
MGLPDFGMSGFQSDEWRFAAVCVLVLGFAVIPSFLAFRNSKNKNEQKFLLALKDLETKLEEAKKRRGKSGKRVRR